MSRSRGLGALGATSAGAVVLVEGESGMARRYATILCSLLEIHRRAGNHIVDWLNCLHTTCFLGVAETYPKIHTTQKTKQKSRENNRKQQTHTEHEAENNRKQQKPTQKET